VVLLPLVLILCALRLESIREEDLDEPGAQLPRSSGDTVTCATIAGGKYFRWNLEYVSNVLVTIGRSNLR
jgi:hypothetical protein